MERRHVAAVAAGGALGASLRWAVGAGLGTGAAFPWATFAVNVAGCGLLGVVLGRPRSPALRAFAAAGFCGGLTTFSTFAVEVTALGGDGRAGVAAVYAVASVAAGLAAFVAGAVAARRAPPPATLAGPA